MALRLDRPPRADSDAVAFAREVVRVEAATLFRVRDQLDETVEAAARRLIECPGCVLVTGMGKAGLVGRKLAATLASTGTRAFPIHPADALHGDLGRIREGDIVIALSQSGETEEVVRLVPSIRRLGATLIAITGSRSSTLGGSADLCLELGAIAEACPLGLAPSASTTAMMAMGDALALLASHLRDFRPEDFARYHPGGKLGRQLGKVEDLMRTGRQIRVARQDETIRDVLVRLGGARRRSGAMLVVDGSGRLAGIFTDSDLARLFENRREAQLDRPLAETMTRDPLRVVVGSAVADAVEILQSRKISELPVVDAAGRPAGLVDITDLIGLVPAELLVEDEAA